MKFLKHMLLLLFLSFGYANSLLVKRKVLLNYDSEPFLLAHGSSGIEEVLVNITIEQALEIETEKVKDLPSILDHAFYGKMSKNFTLPLDYHISKVT